MIKSFELTKNLVIICLLLITIVSFALRIVNISNAPAGFNWDEAALGYNAYSILKTGKDEYGEVLPLIFKSFGDYKPGFYVYLDLPFVALLGLTEISTRLPSIILGSFIPLLGYFLVRTLFPQEKKSLALLSALFLALSPWAINFSRGAWETNVSFFELLLAVYLFIKGKDGKVWYLVVSFVLFALSLYTYQSAKILSLGLVAGLLIIYGKSFASRKVRFWVVGLTVFLLLILLTTLFDSTARSRLTVLNEFNYTRSAQEIDAIKKEEVDQNPFVFNLYHSETEQYIKIVVSRYLSYFSPNFLFIQAAPDARQGTLNYGVMHLIEFPFFLLGIFIFFRKFFKSASAKVFLLWMILSPIPSALSRDAVNTVRILPLAFSLEVIAALGLYTFLNYFKNWALLAFIFVSLLMIFNLGFFLDYYMIHTRVNGSSDWLYGQKQAAEFINDHKNEYQKVVMTTFYNEPYIFYLFYSKYDPATYQKQAKLSMSRGVDVGEVNQIDNIEFRRIDWPKDRGDKNTLFIGNWQELPEQDIDPKEAKLLQTINFLDKTVAMRIVGTNAH